MLFTLSGVSKRPQNDNADPPSPQWAPSKGRVPTAVFKRTGASGRGVGTGNEDDGSVRTGNEDNGRVTTLRQDA
jgi:hypothetical protein